jgi:hypothetical protein
MWKSSSPTVICRSAQLPGLVRRSPFATATRRLDQPYRWTPMRCAMSVSMKLCVEPKSSSAVRGAPATRTTTCIVLAERGWMPVSACSEIVGSVSDSCS